MVRCAQHTLPFDMDAVINESYIPFIPDNWNGVLVCAEAQNLSKKNDAWIDVLMQGSIDDRMRRLYDPELGVATGVGPWDAGYLKLAISILGYDPLRTGVCNAVPWSLRSARGTNRNPDALIQRRSIDFWNNLGETLQSHTKFLLLCGNIANTVLGASTWTRSIEKTVVRLPSPMLLNPASSLFEVEDLIQRYSGIKEHMVRIWGDSPKALTKQRAVYAAHVMSSAKQK